ncbi:MAG: hypothetical protein JXX14_24450 [Deltaproteobacteria bacterium]|nr:hypothetical protein [Deltaproteobacteria bacterium]
MLENTKFYNRYKWKIIALFILVTVVFAQPAAALNFRHGHKSMIEDIVDIFKEYETELDISELDLDDYDEESWTEFVSQFNETRKDLSDLACDYKIPLESTKRLCIPATCVFA